MSESAAGATHSRFFEAWARFVLRHRFLMLATSIALSVFLAHQAATRLQVDTSVDAFIASDSETARVRGELRDDFGVDEVTLIVIEGDVFSEPFLTK